jgi:glycosyltransferase involved in cell wall biosynthesis
LTSNNKLHILHIIPTLKKGGAERLVIDIVRSLLSYDEIRVQVVLFEPNIEYDVSDLTDTIVIIPSSVQLSILKKNRLHIKELQQYIDKFQPDIVHTHLFEAEMVSRSCSYPSAKWFTHAHDRMASFQGLEIVDLIKKRSLTNYAEKRYLLNRYQHNGGNHFIAISQHIQQFLIDVLPNALRNVILLPNAIDVNRFRKPELPVKTERQKQCELVTVGRLDQNKNHSFLIDVVRLLKNQGIPVHLNIIGEGVERQQLEEKVERKKLSNEVTFLGAQERVEECLWPATIYVHSALSEGFGLTLIEAMASGLPVVSLDGGGNRELIVEGKNGFLIKDRDPIKFAERIAYLWTNQEIRLEMGFFAVEFSQQFAIQTYCKILVEHYKDVLACAE